MVSVISLEGIDQPAARPRAIQLAAVEQHLPELEIVLGCAHQAVSAREKYARRYTLRDRSRNTTLARETTSVNSTLCVLSDARLGSHVRIAAMLLGILTAQSAAGQDTRPFDSVVAARSCNPIRHAAATIFELSTLDDHSEITGELAGAAFQSSQTGGYPARTACPPLRDESEDGARPPPVATRQAARVGATRASSNIELLRLEEPGAFAPADTTSAGSFDGRTAESLRDLRSRVFGRGATNHGPEVSSGQLPDDVDFTSTSTWNQLYRNVLRDQKDVLTFPLHVAEGHHWIAAIALTAATVGLVALDPHDTPHFRRTSAFKGFNTVASGFNTGAAMALVPAAFYLSRVRQHDSYGKQTIFAAAEAVADVQIVTFGMKMIDRRIRPVDVPQRGDYADTWFKANVLGGKSFPSGHTVTAFALAEVFVERFREHRWIPWVAYGLATGVGFSRLTLQAHFPSDVFAGAALGIVMTHGLVLNRSASMSR